ncbi:MAG TPA: response regulator [Polyangiaceae bacterium]|nr:response regulator [Polyangiaceae bacterium]
MSNASAPSTAKKRVLIADDDAAISRLLERILGREYDVIVAADGGGALALADQTRPQLMILDVMMPGMDGFALAQRVRMLPHLRQVPIIFLTARDGPLDTIKGIQAGARHYVTKPFKIDELVTKVKKVLG